MKIETLNLKIEPLDLKNTAKNITVGPCFSRFSLAAREETDSQTAVCFFFLFAFSGKRPMCYILCPRCQHAMDTIDCHQGQFCPHYFYINTEFCMTCIIDISKNLQINSHLPHP